MMKANGGLLAAVVVCALLSACATSGTRVSTASDTYRQWPGANRHGVRNSVATVILTASRRHARWSLLA
jgi:outer membrane biogenesis lipoprotein LolB